MPCVTRSAVLLRQRRRQRSRCTVRKPKTTKNNVPKKTVRAAPAPRARNAPIVEAVTNQSPPMVQEDFHDMAAELPNFGAPVLPFSLPNLPAPIPNVPAGFFLGRCGDIHRLPSSVNGLFDPTVQSPAFGNTAFNPLGYYHDQQPLQVPLPFIYPTSQPLPHFNHFNPPPPQSTIPVVRTPTPALSLMEDGSNMSVTPTPVPSTDFTAHGPAFPSLAASDASTLVAPVPVSHPPFPFLGEGGLFQELFTKPGPSNQAPLDIQASFQDKGKGRGVEIERLGSVTPCPARDNEDTLYAKQRVRTAVQEIYHALDAFLGVIDRV